MVPRKNFTKSGLYYIFRCVHCLRSLRSLRSFDGLDGLDELFFSKEDDISNNLFKTFRVSVATVWMISFKSKSRVTSLLIGFVCPKKRTLDNQNDVKNKNFRKNSLRILFIGWALLALMIEKKSPNSRKNNFMLFKVKFLLNWPL